MEKIIVNKPTAREQYIAGRINQYYADAWQDYGVKGHVISCTEFDGCCRIKWQEDGEDDVLYIEYADDYTAEQIFYIWMEER